MKSDSSLRHLQELHRDGHRKPRLGCQRHVLGASAPLQIETRGGLRRPALALRVHLDLHSTQNHNPGLHPNIQGLEAIIFGTSEVQASTKAMRILALDRISNMGWAKYGFSKYLDLPGKIFTGGPTGTTAPVQCESAATSGSRGVRPDREGTPVLFGVFQSAVRNRRRQKWRRRGTGF